jgi:hypothetical protein
VTCQALTTVSFAYGLGKHDLSLRQPGEMINVLKWNWIASTPGMLVSILARISIAILLIRLFGIHVWLKWYLIIFTGLQTLVGGLIIPFTWVQDDPVSGLWNIYDPTVKHWDPRIVLYMEYLGQCECSPLLTSHDSPSESEVANDDAIDSHVHILRLDVCPFPSHYNLGAENAIASSYWTYSSHVRLFVYDDDVHFEGQGSSGIIACHHRCPVQGESGCSMVWHGADLRYHYGLCSYATQYHQSGNSWPHRH